MNRYFFDFDGVRDRCGIMMSSAHNACAEAILAMPNYVAEVLERGGGKAEMTCSIRENDDAASFRIVMSMRVEDGSGRIIESPIRPDEARAAKTA